jgi:hypothetical protein
MIKVANVKLFDARVIEVCVVPLRGCIPKNSNPEISKLHDYMITCQNALDLVFGFEVERKGLIRLTLRIINGYR